jgi:hypothetical protein
MLYRPKASGKLCESCRRKPATHNAKFAVRYLQSALVIFPYDDEVLAEAQLELRVCVDCVEKMQRATNISNLLVERIEAPQLMLV